MTTFSIVGIKSGKALPDGGVELLVQIKYVGEITLAFPAGCAQQLTALAQPAGRR